MPPLEPRTVKRKAWDATKWFTLAVLLTGVGVGAQAALGQKADRAELDAVRADVSAIKEARATEAEADRWNDAMLCAIAQKVGAPVLPNPNCK